MTVIAAAAPGRMLSDITQWTHTFRTAPAGCSAANQTHAGPVSTRPTAHPGPETAQLIVLGSLFLLTGTVCLVAASARRVGTVRP